MIKSQIFSMLRGAQMFVKPCNLMLLWKKHYLCACSHFVIAWHSLQGRLLCSFMGKQMMLKWVYSLQQLHVYTYMYVTKIIFVKIILTDLLTIRMDVAIVQTDDKTFPTDRQTVRKDANFFERIGKPFEQILIFVKWIGKPFEQLINHFKWLS